MAQFPPEPAAALTQQLRDVGYLADRGLSTATFLATTLGRPLLLEGEVGVGKTELAKTLATMYGRQLIRLQCYEGIDTNQALYEWDYARQMLKVRAMNEQHASDDASIDHLFSDEFLVERPLLQAIRAGDRCVLLIDEVDRADDEFEAFLLELLSDFQITIPERGTIRAESKPIVILTSNRTRELHDALKRRCLYHWIGFPSPEREVDIVTTRVPGVRETMAERAIRDQTPYDLWERDGWLNATPGKVIGFDFVAARLAEYVGLYDIQALAYDSYGFNRHFEIGRAHV